MGGFRGAIRSHHVAGRMPCTRNVVTAAMFTQIRFIWNWGSAPPANVHFLPPGSRPNVTSVAFLIVIAGLVIDRLRRLNGPQRAALASFHAQFESATEGITMPQVGGE